MPFSDETNQKIWTKSKINRKVCKLRCLSVELVVCFLKPFLIKFKLTFALLELSMIAKNYRWLSIPWKIWYQKFLYKFWYLMITWNFPVTSYRFFKIIFSWIFLIFFSIKLFLQIIKMHFSEFLNFFFICRLRKYSKNIFFLNVPN